MTDTSVHSRARLHGLDGLRAVAVTLVVVYHLFPGSILRGGFVGVDVFFVISGFLITTLLLGEQASTGKIGLVDFWRRRARRLLPALAVLLTVCASAAWLIGGDVLMRMGAQLVGALTFTYNWVSIADAQGYFSATSPELFRNLWSLAVEEQFYVLWPLLLPLLLLIPGAIVRAVVALVTASASAAWMAYLALDALDPTRAYFGTDSHAFGLLIGVALAFLRGRMLRQAATAPTRSAPGWVGVLALAGVVVVATVPASAITFPWMLLLGSIFTAVLIVVGTAPGSVFGRAIDVAPLRWIGDRSYGIYLWHWPLLVLIVAAVQGTGPEAGVPAWIGACTLALTLVAAEVSYRVIEQPVRRYGFRGSLRRLGSRLAGAPGPRFAGLSLVTAAVLAIGGTTAAVAAAPSATRAEDIVAAGAAAVSAQPTATPTRPAPTPTPTRRPTPDVAATPTPPAPTPVPGTDISAIGDSVMLASAPALYAVLPGIAVDATVSRSMWAAPGILRQWADTGQLRRYVVIGLGTNGPVDAGSLAEAASIAGPDRTVILVNAFAPRDWIPGVNNDLQVFASGHPGVLIADWSAAIAPRTDLLAGDQIHPGSGGGDVYAQVIADTIARAEDARLQREYLAEWSAYWAEHPRPTPFPFE